MISQENGWFRHAAAKVPTPGVAGPTFLRNLATRCSSSRLLYSNVSFKHVFDHNIQ